MEVVRTLLCYRPNLNVRGAQGRTALHCALYNRHENIAILLTNKGADLELSDADGNEPVRVAVAYVRTAFGTLARCTGD